MDTSKEYIEMCRKAVEIQDVEGKYCKTVGEHRQNFFSYPDKVWLPRQDQLQGMVKQHHDCTSHNVRSEFYQWYKKDINESGGVLETWTDERLWLAFVMRSLHGKKWDGAEWR